MSFELDMYGSYKPTEASIKFKIFKSYHVLVGAVDSPVCGCHHHFQQTGFQPGMVEPCLWSAEQEIFPVPVCACVRFGHSIPRQLVHLPHPG